MRSRPCPPGRTAAGTVQHHQHETPTAHQALAAARIYDPTCEDHLNRHDVIPPPGLHMAAGFAALAWPRQSGQSSHVQIVPLCA